LITVNNIVLRCIFLVTISVLRRQVCTELFVNLKVTNALVRPTPFCSLVASFWKLKMRSSSASKWTVFTSAVRFSLMPSTSYNVLRACCTSENSKRGLISGQVSGLRGWPVCTTSQLARKRQNELLHIPSELRLHLQSSLIFISMVCKYNNVLPSCMK
jgi:hypothetical protein